MVAHGVKLFGIIVFGSGEGWVGTEDSCFQGNPKGLSKCLLGKQLQAVGESHPSNEKFFQLYSRAWWSSVFQKTINFF